MVRTQAYGIFQAGQIDSRVKQRYILRTVLHRFARGETKARCHSFDLALVYTASGDEKTFLSSLWTKGIRPTLYLALVTLARPVVTAVSDLVFSRGGWGMNSR